MKTRLRASEGKSWQQRHFSRGKVTLLARDETTKSIQTLKLLVPLLPGGACPRQQRGSGWRGRFRTPMAQESEAATADSVPAEDQDDAVIRLPQFVGAMRPMLHARQLRRLRTRTRQLRSSKWRRLGSVLRTAPIATLQAHKLQEKIDKKTKEATHAAAALALASQPGVDPTTLSWWQQGDIEMYSKDNLEARLKLRNDPQVVEQLQVSLGVAPAGAPCAARVLLSSQRAADQPACCCPARELLSSERAAVQPICCCPASELRHLRAHASPICLQLRGADVATPLTERRRPPPQLWWNTAQRSFKKGDPEATELSRDGYIKARPESTGMRKEGSMASAGRDRAKRTRVAEAADSAAHSAAGCGVAEVIVFVADCSKARLCSKGARVLTRGAAWPVDAQMCLKLYRVMIEVWDADEAMIAAEDDWEVDADDEESMGCVSAHP